MEIIGRIEELSLEFARGAYFLGGTQLVWQFKARRNGGLLAIDSLDLACETADEALRWCQYFGADAGAISRFGFDRGGGEEPSVPNVWFLAVPGQAREKIATAIVVHRRSSQLAA